jgi:hypothetical protein
VRTSVSHSLGFTSQALQQPNREYIIAAFSAASWFPQNIKFFLPSDRGRIAFSARLLSGL